MRSKLSQPAIFMTLVLLLPNAMGGYAQSLKLDPQKDLISLHYDFAPDWDDAESAVADRMILQEKFGKDWLNNHIVAVSGTYGTNKNEFHPESDAVMNSVWGSCCGWIAANKNWEAAVLLVFKKWTETITSGGEIWVKEGGQSDFTADIIRKIQKENPHIEIKHVIHVVQHSDWNEKATTNKELVYVKKFTDYIRIPDANHLLNNKNGSTHFAVQALAQPKYSSMWHTAFRYLSPRQRVDFSDTGELFKILDMKIMSVTAFADHYFK